MSDSIRAGGFRVCPYCASRNKAVHKYCVRCSAPMESAAPGTQAARVAEGGNNRLTRFLVAAGVIAAIGVGLMWRTVSKATGEVAALSEDVRADNTVTTLPAPPPTVSGWYPGANVPVEPDTAPAWTSESMPTPRINPYDVPGDPSTSMVGIAPSSPRVRAAVNRRRVYTEQDLLATRGGAWSAPAPTSGSFSAESRVQEARARLQQARSQRSRSVDVDDDHVQKAIEQAADDLREAEADMARSRLRTEDRR